MGSSLGQTETEPDALMAIRQATAGFYCLAIIHFALGVLDLPFLVQETFSTLLYLVFAVLLQALKSRVLAWVMLVFTVANVVGTVATMVEKHTICCYYLLIQMWASVRAVQGTSKWQKLQAARMER